MLANSVSSAAKRAAALVAENSAADDAAPVAKRHSAQAYGPDMRHAADVVCNAGVSAADIRAVLAGPSESTVWRWQRIPVTPPNPRGCPSVVELHTVMAHVPWLLFTNLCTANTALTDALAHAFGRPFSASAISRHLGMLHITHKKLERIVRQRCEDARVAWWAPPPNVAHGIRAGVQGVPAEGLVDLDECAVFVRQAESSTGRSFKGTLLSDSPARRMRVMMPRGCASDCHWRVHWENCSVSKPTICASSTHTARATPSCLCAAISPS